jgi:hypothetical protein
MSFALVMHMFIVFFRIPFPGYDHLGSTMTIVDSESLSESGSDEVLNQGQNVHSATDNGLLNENQSFTTVKATSHPPGNYSVRSPPRVPPTALFSNDESGRLPTYTASHIYFGDAHESKPKLPLSMYFILAIPALLDLGGAVFSIAGLVYLDVSIFQMISNSSIVFVALMKHFILKNLLHKYHWFGVFWIATSVIIGGSSALLESQVSGNVTDGSVTATDTLVGVFLVMTGTALFAVQTVIEEKLISLDVPVPPLLLVGMQGLWGVVLSTVVLFPAG